MSNEPGSIEGIVEESRRLWEEKAGFWDEYVGPESNEWHRVLIAPAQLRLLDLKLTDEVLEIACGNGQFAREMARHVASVTACDASPTFVERARRHTQKARMKNVDYSVVDATDEPALLAFGIGRFDAAVCTMAIMDLPAIEPMLRAVHLLLKPHGRLVFSVTHPAFNSTGTRLVEEQEERDGELVANYAVKVGRYLDIPVERGVAIRGEPVSHYYFHRSLSRLFGACFEAGFAVDGLEEPAFAEPAPERRSFDWRNYGQIPPVLVVRLRPVHTAS